MNLPIREQALTLLNEWVSEPYQILHSKMVANALEMYAEKFGEYRELWYITGLLHDLDYNKHPDEHPKVSVEFFRENGYPEELIHAVAAHAWERTGVKPESMLAKTLVATDEMCGLIYAYSLVRGADKFNGMEVKSVLKRFKELKFAAKISREEIRYGVELMGITMEEHVANLIPVFQKMEEFRA
jgi:putative nucleotidyltransferase with HDIG domain